jgi:3-oxoacyl-[acyl-carrier-protein] synthase II
MTIPMLIPNEGAGNISMAFGLHGATHTIATACASGTDAIGNAFDEVRSGRYDVVLAGGAESTQCGYGNLGFTMLHALSSKWTDDPSKSCRPFDKDRDGFIMGEGSTILILEEYEHAKARGAKIYAEIVGFGTTTDGTHITSPNQPTIAHALQLAIDDAGISPDKIGYINTHGTGTTMGDITETSATYDVFKRAVPVSTVKNYIGHTLGACGAIESWLTINMMNEGWFMPNLNLNELDPECAPLDYITGDGRQIETEYVMNNNFAFGGVNTSLIFRKIK